MYVYRLLSFQDLTPGVTRAVNHSVSFLRVRVVRVPSCSPGPASLPRPALLPLRLPTALPVAAQSSCRHNPPLRSPQLLGGPAGRALGLRFTNVPVTIKPASHCTDWPVPRSQMGPQSCLLGPEAFPSGKHLCLLPTNIHYFPDLDVQSPKGHDWILEWTSIS